MYFDYCFIRRREEKSTQTVLVMKDRSSIALRAWLLRHRGVQEEDPAELAAAGVTDLGLQNRVWIEVDNEPALIALRDAILKKLKIPAGPIEAPAKESQTCGAVENGIKVFKGLLRVHLGALEDRIQGTIPTDHPVMSHLVAYVSDLVTKHLVGKDGKTA